MSVQKEIKSKMGIAIAAAFGFVMALTWNEFIKGSVAKIMAATGIAGSGYLISLAAAVITTIICVCGIMYFSKWG